MKRITFATTAIATMLAVSPLVEAQSKGVQNKLNPGKIPQVQVKALPQVINPQFGQTAPGQNPGGVTTKQLVIDPSQPNSLAYFSSRLGARFLVEPMYQPQYGSFWGARIVSKPEWNSPLRQMGLDEGDVITRLDGIPVMNTQELERHILQTSVRYLKVGHDHVHQTTAYIDPNRYFQDPYGGWCGPYGNGGHGHGGYGNVALQP